MRAGRFAVVPSLLGGPPLAYLPGLNYSDLIAVEAREMAGRSFNIRALTAPHLARLEAWVAQRVLNRLRWFAENFEAIRPEELTGQFPGGFKLRVGNYRVFYICDQTERKKERR